LNMPKLKHMKSILKHSKGKVFIATILLLMVGVFFYWDVLVFHAKDLLRDNKGWAITTSEEGNLVTKRIVSPTFHVNAVFPSMTGPWDAHYFNLERSAGPELVWFTGYRCFVQDAESKNLLGDEFLCHNSLDYSIQDYYHNWGIKGRAGVFTSRLATMTQGQTEMSLPAGFGIPLQSDQALSALTQVLNVNDPEADCHVEYVMEVDYIANASSKEIKPLFQQSISVLVAVDTNYVYHDSLPEVQDCMPVLASTSFMTKCRDGNTYTGHWQLPEGRDTVTYDVTDILSLPFNTTLHYAGVHVHPHCESLELWDRTADSLVFRSTIDNHKSLSKMKEITAYSSKSGVMMYSDHRYELVCETNGVSKSTKDMMATMLLYLYDHEMDAVLSQL